MEVLCASPGSSIQCHTRRPLVAPALPCVCANLGSLSHEPLLGRRKWQVARELLSPASSLPFSWLPAEATTKVHKGFGLVPAPEARCRPSPTCSDRKDHGARELSSYWASVCRGSSHRPGYPQPWTETDTGPPRWEPGVTGGPCIHRVQESTYRSATGRPAA